MSAPDFQHIRMSMVRDVVLVEIISKDLQGPKLAQELSAELNQVIQQEWAKRLLVDFSSIRYLSSTGFAVLVGLVTRAKAAGREVKFCNMHPDLRVGADIIGLGTIVEIHDTEDSAPARSRSPEPILARYIVRGRCANLLAFLKPPFHRAVERRGVVRLHNLTVLGISYILLALFKQSPRLGKRLFGRRVVPGP